MNTYSLSTYDYILPESLIAQDAVHPHHDAKLLVAEDDPFQIVHEGTFWDLGDILSDNDVLFFNNSRVIPARIPLHGIKIERPDGTTGTIEKGEILFCQKLPSGRFEALVRPGAKFRIGTKIIFPEGYIEVVDMSDTGRVLEAHAVSIEDLMEKYGELPLPPYIEYKKEKETDYQTVFAKNNGSVAAPTASLHFTRELLENIKCQKEYVTLHVGLGTFKGIDVEDIREYHIHRETIEVPLSIFETIMNYKRNKKCIIAVGTTVCRTLESLPSLWASLQSEDRHLFDADTRSYWDAHMIADARTDWVHSLCISGGTLRFETSIYITPGFHFQIIDGLITNFHLPQSSLLVLVSAFFGNSEIGTIYKHAIEKKYRFFSFGDGMYLKKRK